MGWMRALARWVLRIGLAASVLGVLLAGAGFLWLDSAAGRDWVRRTAEKALGEAFGAEVVLGSLARSSGLAVTARDLDVTIEGRPFVVARRVEARPAFPSLWPPALALAIDVSGFEVRIGRGPDGRFDVERLDVGGDPSEPSPIELTAITFAVDDGTVRVEDVATAPIALSGVAANGELLLGSGSSVQLAVESAGGRVGELGFSLEGSMDLGADETVAAAVRIEGSLGAELAELAALEPSLDVVAQGDVSGALMDPTAELHLEAASASLVADLAYAPSRGDGGDGTLSGTLRLAKLDPMRLTAEAPAAELSGSGSFSIAPARGLDGLQAELQLHDSTLADLRLEKAAATARTADGALALELQAAAPGRAADVTAAGSIALTEPHAATLRAELALDDPRALPPRLAEWLAASRLRGRVEARAERLAEESREVHLALELDPGRVRGLELRRAYARADLSGTLLEIPELEVVGEGTKLRGVGRAELSEKGIVEARLAGPVDLRLLPETSGVVNADVELRGRLDDLSGSARLASVDRIVRPELEARLEVGAEVRGFGTGAATASLRSSGRAQPRGSLLDAFGGALRDFELSASFREQGTAVAAGGLAGRLEASLAVTEPDGRDHLVAAAAQLGAAPLPISLEALEVAPADGAPWKLAQPVRLSLGADSLSLSALRVVSRDGIVAAEGVLRRGTGRNDLRASLRDVDLALACALGQLRESCAGRVDLQLTASGTGAAPVFDATLAVDGVRVAGRDYGDLRTTLHVDRRLRFEASLGDGGAAGLRADGSLGLTTGGFIPVVDRAAPMELRARVEALPLSGFRALAGEVLSDLDGTIRAEIRADGTPDRPRIDGEITSGDLLFTLADTGVTYADGRVAIRLDSDGVRLTQLSFAQRTVEGGGYVALDGFVPSSLDLWLELDEAPLLARPQADARASGRITLTGTAEAPLVAGEIVVGPATIRPTLAAGGSGPAPDPTITVIRGPEAPVEGPDDPLGMLLAGQPVDAEEDDDAEDEVPPVGSPEPMDRLAVQLQVRVGERVLIQRTDALLRLTGDLRITKAPGGDVRVVGAIESENGWYVFQGRRIQIERAALRFGGEWPIDPQLDVHASARSGGYLVDIAVQGSLAEPTLDLSSSPPLDQGDILAVLIFGKPLSQLSGAQGEVVQQQALGVLASYVAPELQRSLMDSFGLVAVSFTMPTGDRAGTVGIGRYFGDDIFVSLAQDFGGPKGGTQRQLQGLIGTSVTIQYSLTPSLTLQTASSTEGESSVDVIWHRRY